MRSIFVHCIIISAALLVSCDDPLPPYQKPENFLRGVYTSVDTSTIRYFGSLDRGTFSFSSSFQFTLGVQNVYEETIQSTADISGKLELWLPDSPDARATINVNSDQALEFNGPNIFDRTRNIITLDPTQILYLKVIWNFRMDDGKWINQYLTNYTQVEYKNLNYYRYHKPTPLHARLTVSLFKNTAPVVADTTITLILLGDVHYAAGIEP